MVLVGKKANKHQGTGPFVSKESASKLARNWPEGVAQVVPHGHGWAVTVPKDLVKDPARVIGSANTAERAAETSQGISWQPDFKESEITSQLTSELKVGMQNPNAQIYVDSKDDKTKIFVAPSLEGAFLPYEDSLGLFEEADATEEEMEAWDERQAEQEKTKTIEPEPLVPLEEVKPKRESSKKDLKQRKEEDDMFKALEKELRETDKAYSQRDELEIKESFQKYAAVKEGQKLLREFSKQPIAVEEEEFDDPELLQLAMMGGHVPLDEKIAGQVILNEKTKADKDEAKYLSDWDKAEKVDYKLDKAKRKKQEEDMFDAFEREQRETILAYKQRDEDESEEELSKYAALQGSESTLKDWKKAEATKADKELNKGRIFDPKEAERFAYAQEEKDKHKADKEVNWGRIFDSERAEHAAYKEDGKREDKQAKQEEKERKQAEKELKDKENKSNKESVLFDDFSKSIKRAGAAATALSIAMAKASEGYRTTEAKTGLDDKELAAFRTRVSSEGGDVNEAMAFVAEMQEYKDLQNTQIKTPEQAQRFVDLTKKVEVLKQTSDIGGKWTKDTSGLEAYNLASSEIQRLKGSDPEAARVMARQYNLEGVLHSKGERQTLQDIAGNDELSLGSKFAIGTDLFLEASKAFLGGVTTFEETIETLFGKTSQASIDMSTKLSQEAAFTDKSSTYAPSQEQLKDVGAFLQKIIDSFSSDKPKDLSFVSPNHQASMVANNQVVQVEGVFHVTGDIKDSRGNNVAVSGVPVKVSSKTKDR